MLYKNIVCHTYILLDFVTSLYIFVRIFGILLRVYYDIIGTVQRKQCVKSINN
jgi:hypothetical protein